MSSRPLTPPCVPFGTRRFNSLSAVPCKTDSWGKSDLPLYLYAMYQHPDMQPLNIITACCDTLYASDTLFPDDRSIQDRKTTCAGSRTNVTPIGYFS